jgi:hypothetical protein
LKPAVQLTAVSIKLPAAGTEILFTYYYINLLNRIISSASKSIIYTYFYPLGVSKSVLPFFSQTHIHNICEKYLSAFAKFFKPNRFKPELQINGKEYG